MKKLINLFFVVLILAFLYMVIAPFWMLHKDSQETPAEETTYYIPGGSLEQSFKVEKKPEEEE